MKESLLIKKEGKEIPNRKRKETFLNVWGGKRNRGPGKRSWVVAAKKRRRVHFGGARIRPKGNT